MKYSSENPDPVDMAVGRRLRLRRRLLRLSQQQVADAVGVTFQQVQKYERGANRLSASRLWDFATILGVDISFFFEDLDTVDQERTSIPRVRQEESHGGESFLPDNPMAKTETLELCQAFWRLRPGIRQVFADFLIAASHPRIARTGKDEADAA